MARVSSITRLSAEQNATVDRIIRRFRYVNLDGILFALEEEGIELSRSALHRYCQRIQQRDSTFSGTADDTIVVIIERGTGATTTISTPLTREALTALIEAKALTS